MRNRCLGFAVALALLGCAKSAPPVAAAAASPPNLSVIGKWATSNAAEPRTRQEELETLFHPQFKLNQEQTFTLYQGRKYTGRWRLTGHALRLDIRSSEDSDKKGVMVATSATMDLTLSEDGKTLTQTGRGGSVFHRLKN